MIRKNNSEALRWAAESKNLSLVQLLIPVSDPQARNSYALRWAAKNGHLSLVQLLIPVSNPKAYNSEALRWASSRGHVEIFDLLWEHSDPKEALEIMIAHDWKENFYFLIKQRLQAEEERELLNTSLRKKTESKLSKLKPKM